MDIAELKRELINQIDEIEDKGRLEELMLLLQLKRGESVFSTSQEEKKAIYEARAELSAGEMVANDELQKAIQQWLK